VSERKHNFVSFRVQYLCKKQIPHFVRNDTFTTNLIVFVQALIRFNFSVSSRWYTYSNAWSDGISM